MIALLKNLIKFARITQSGNEDGEQPIQQVEYNNKTGTAFIIFPYGMHANLPVDSLVTVFNVGSNEQNRIAIGGMPDKRIKVEDGEVVFFHPETKSQIYFKSSGDIDIKSTSNININCEDLNVNCTNLNATCDSATIESTTNIDINTPLTTMDGNLTVTGVIETAGLSSIGGGNVNITGGGTVLVDGVDIGPDHTHNSGTLTDSQAGAVTGNTGDVNP